MISRNFYTILIPKKLGICTVCKLQEFPVTQILREIKVDESRILKSDISLHFEALNFDFHEVLHFGVAKIYLINNIQTS